MSNSIEAVPAATTTFPVISIVVINKNEDQVAITLDALVELRRGRPDIELIVVDASEQKFAALNCPDIASWDDFKPIPGRVTIPHQRNRGVALARGRVIVFLDAGCDFDDQWLDELTLPIVSGSELMVTGVWPEQPQLRSREIANTSADLVYVKSCPTLTVAISRRVLELVGPFDESFAYGSDLDFCIRAGAHGVRILQNPRARVWVDWGGGRRRAKRNFVYGRARVRLLRKHGRAYVNAAGLPARVFAYPLYLIVLPLTLRYRWLPLLGLAAFARSLARQGADPEAFKYCEAAGMLIEVIRPTRAR